MTRIAVLVVTYGSAGLFEDCAASICRQEGPFELSVFVQDNSVDEGSRSAIREICRRRGFDHRCSGTNLGFAAGVNAARARSEKSYASELLILNPDAVLGDGAVAEMVRCDPGAGGIIVPVHEDADGGFVSSVHPLPTPSTFIGVVARVVLGRRRAARLRSSRVFRAVAARGSWKHFLDSGEDTPPSTGAVELADAEYASGACWLIDAQHFDDLDGFDERFFMYCEDADFTQRSRALGSGCGVRQIPSAVLRHVPGLAGGSEIYESPQIVVPYLQYLRKHYPVHAKCLVFAFTPFLAVVGSGFKNSAARELTILIRAAT